MYLPPHEAQGLPYRAKASLWNAALASEKQQNMTCPTVGAAGSASIVAWTAIFAARSAGNRYTPVEIAENASEVSPLACESSSARR